MYVCRVHGAVPFPPFPYAQITKGGAAQATGKLRLGDHILEVSVHGNHTSAHTAAALILHQMHICNVSFR